MSPREDIADSFPRKIAIATRLFGKELQRSKLKWFDLQRADYRLGEKMLAVGVSAEHSQFAQRVDQIDDRLTTLRQHERNPSDTFGGKVKSWWKGMIRTVRIAALERQRRSTLKQLGVAVRKSPGPNTSRTSESQAAGQIGEKITSIDASIRELRASTYVWARRPLLTSSLVLLLAMVALASFKAQYLQSRVVRRNGAPSSLSEDQFKKIESQTQAFREQVLRQQAELLRQETEATQARIAAKSDEQRRDVLRRAQEEVRRQVAAAEDAYKEQQERQRAEAEKRQREEAQERERVAAAERARAEEKQREEDRRIAAEKAKQEEQAREVEAQRESQRQKAAPIAEHATKQNAGEQLAKVKTAAEAGDREAMFNLGNRYMKGNGVEKDLAEGVRWLRKAVEAGNTRAMVNLGLLYSDGEGVAKDPAEALRWYKKAADLGDTDGMLNLGIAYHLGEGVEKDLNEAFRWYRKAADSGHSYAMFAVGSSYESGDGVEKDVAEAFRWYRKAAEAGNPLGMFNVGNAYFDGEGVRKDLSESVRWYRKAADAGNTAAMVNLARCYQRGAGVAKDLAEATGLLRKAAEGGQKEAIAALKDEEQQEAAAVDNRQAASSKAQSENAPIQSPHPRSEDSIAVERWTRSRLIGGLTEKQIVQLSDLIAEKFAAPAASELRSRCFKGTGDQRQFDRDMVYRISKGEYVPSARSLAKRLDLEIDEMVPPRAVFKMPLREAKALPPIEEPIHQGPRTPQSLTVEHLETLDSAVSQLAEKVVLPGQPYRDGRPSRLTYLKQLGDFKGGDVLCCRYQAATAEEWSHPYYFWYKEAPPGLQELLKTLPPEHPIRLIGPPRSDAPANLSLAMDANQATADAVQNRVPDERAQADALLDSRGVDPQVANVLRPYLHKAADAAHARRADSERIVKSGGAKMLCPKCDGYKLISRRYYDSSRNPYSWNDPMYSVYEHNRSGVSMENCDVCGGTGAIR